jgi:uncharacterized protein YodC (DUF2158 family)
LNDDDYQEDPKDDSQVYDDDDFEDDKKSSSTVSTIVEDESYIIDERVEVVEQGKRIVLKCSKPHETNDVIIFYKGKNILMQGAAEVMKNLNQNPRYDVNVKDGTLSILDVSSKDSGEYRCRTFDTKNAKRYQTKIQVIVNGPPSDVTIGHNQDESLFTGLDKKFTYKLGEKGLRFKCNNNTNSKVKISWNHNGNPIQPVKDHDFQIIGQDLLEFNSLHARHAGKYVCEVSNDYGTAKAGFELDVQCKK